MPRRSSIKAAPFLWPAWVNGEPIWHMVDFREYVEKGFELNPLIYSAIMYKYRALTSAPLRAYTGELDNPKRLPPTHRLAKLLLRPNQHQSSIEFLGQQDVYLNVSGNSYTYLDRGKQRRQAGDPAPPPEALWNLRPDRVHIVPGDGGIKGFMYRPEGKSLREAMPILPEDMMHVKLPNPGDPYEGMGYGLSPMAALARDGDTDNSVTDFLKLLFDNKTMLGGVLKFNMPMTDEDVAAARRRWQEIYGGVEHWGDVAVLDNAGDFQPMSPDFQKLNFQSIDSRNEKRIMGPFGVPGMLIGVTMEDSTFSNFDQADEVFWRNTFVPELSLFEVEYQHFLSDGDAFPMYDKSAVPALQENITEKIDGAHKLWTMGTPRKTAFTVVGLRVPDTEFDDVSFVPSGVIPAAQAGKPSAPQKQADDIIILPPPAPVNRLPSGSKATPSVDQKKIVWKALDDIAISHESAFEGGARKQFEADKRAILAMLNDVKARALERRATIDWLPMLDDVKAYLAGAGAQGWRTTFVPLLTAVITDAGNYWSTQLGIQFNVRNLLGEAWFADYVLVFADPINETTANTMQTVLAQAQKEGWSIPEMQRNLETLFKQWMQGNLTADDFAWFTDRLPPHRSELIARTETTRIQNAGSYNLFKLWGLKKKEWLSTQDNRVRDTHSKAGGQIKAIDEPFEVGGYKMNYPGDTSFGAPIREIANCRCAVASFADEADE